MPPKTCASNLSHLSKKRITGLALSAMCQNRNFEKSANVFVFHNICSLGKDIECAGNPLFMNNAQNRSNSPSRNS
jgi:hypothetical protein